jgi:hypothetical protein
MLGKPVVNLVNTVGPHRRAPILDSIPPTGSLDVTFRQAANPTTIMLEPAHYPSFTAELLEDVCIT